MRKNKIQINFPYLLLSFTITVAIIWMSSIQGQSFFGNPSLLKRIICNLAHIPVFVLLTFFWLKALEPGKKERHSKKYIALILACLLLFAVSDEFHQYFVPGRSATIMDLGLDLLGILFGLSVYLSKYGEFGPGKCRYNFKSTGHTQDGD